MILEIIALTAVAYLAGLLTAGLIIRHHIRVQEEAPAPIDLGYDPNNPINQGGQVDQLEVDGVKLWRIC